MRSRAAFRGHPFHPMLVAVPIGLFIWTLIADVVYLATGKDAVWYDIAYWSGLAAWISALVAAIPGLVDFFTVALKSDARSIAIAHLVLNLAVVALFFVATLIMLDDGATTGRDLTITLVLHALGVGLLGLSGWLGGDMVYIHHIGMVPDDSRVANEEEERHVRGARRMRRA